MIHKVGVIGLGNMGLPMATTLQRAGFTVMGYDVSAPRRTLAAQQALRIVDGLPALLAEADAVVASLPYARDVEAALTIQGGLLARQDRRVIVLDTSTADPATSRRLAATLGAAGHGHLDAPVSGGPAGAAAGTLAMMVGGAAEDYAAAAPLVATLADKAVHVGPSGAGNVAKLVNNMLVAAHMITTAEALRLARAAGVDDAATLAVVNAATGRSAVSEKHYPTWVLPARFDSGFSTGLMRKDAALAMALADELGASLPLCRAAAALWAAAPLADSEDFTRIGEERGP